MQAGRPRLAGFGRGRRVTRQDLINFCFDIEQMSRSGIPMLDGLRDLRNSIDNPRFREVLTVMIEDMEGGKVLSQCMAAHPEIFDKVFVSLVGAGEQTGRLPEVFQSLADSLKWQDELASQTKRLLIYPAMVLLVVMAVVLFLLIYLVPQVTRAPEDHGHRAADPDACLIAASNIVVEWWPLIFGLPIVAAIVIAMSIARSRACSTSGTREAAASGRRGDPAEDHPGALRHVLRADVRIRHHRARSDADERGRSSATA